MDISFVVLSALTLGLVQMVKLTVNLPSKFIPLTALGVAIGVSLLAMPLNSLGLVSSIFQGLVIGLGSVGLYSGVKNTIE